MILISVKHIFLHFNHAFERLFRYYGCNAVAATVRREMNLISCDSVCHGKSPHTSKIIKAERDSH